MSRRDSCHKGRDKRETEEKGRKEGFVRERERAKPADQPSLPCSVFHTNSSCVCECIWAVAPVPVCICSVACYIRMLIVLHKASLPNFFVCEGTEKEIFVLLYDLCVYGFAWL